MLVGTWDYRCNKSTHTDCSFDGWFTLMPSKLHPIIHTVCHSEIKIGFQLEGMDYSYLNFPAKVLSVIVQIRHRYENIFTKSTKFYRGNFEQ